MMYLLTGVKSPLSLRVPPYKNCKLYILSVSYEMFNPLTLPNWHDDMIKKAGFETAEALYVMEFNHCIKAGMLTVLGHLAWPCTKQDC